MTCDTILGLYLLQMETDTAHFLCFDMFLTYIAVWLVVIVEEYPTVCLSSLLLMGVRVISSSSLGLLGIVLFRNCQVLLSILVG